MKNFLVTLLLLPLLAGCLSSAPEAPTNWMIDMSRTPDTAVRSDVAISGSVRLVSVDVRPPYSGQRLVVLRSDGTVAFDPFNVFPAAPGLLLRGAAVDALVSSKKFSRIVPPSSSAQTTYSVELVVPLLALDCRNTDERLARVNCELFLLRGREVVASSRGSGTAPAGDDFSQAFSRAFARAMAQALDELAVK